MSRFQARVDKLVCKAAEKANAGERRRAHALGFPRPYPLDRVRTLRPVRELRLEQNSASCLVETKAVWHADQVTWRDLARRSRWANATFASSAILTP
jgi:hypothetical protein